MKIIKPSVDLQYPCDGTEGMQCIDIIEKMARISHKSEGKQTVTSWERFIKAVVLDHGDWSVVEHATAVALFRVNRGVTHELVRHRLFSYTQESTRFVNGRKSYPDGIEFILPAVFNFYDTNIGNITQCLQQAETTYTLLLDAGMRPQEARAVLPNALAATIGMTGNLRSWRSMLLMRTTKETHPDFKQVAVPLLQMFKDRVPLLFDDIIPEARQADNMRLPR